MKDSNDESLGGRSEVILTNFPSSNWMTWNVGKDYHSNFRKQRIVNETGEHKQTSTPGSSFRVIKDQVDSVFAPNVKKLCLKTNLKDVKDMCRRNSWTTKRRKKIKSKGGFKKEQSTTSSTDKRIQSKTTVPLTKIKTEHVTGDFRKTPSRRIKKNIEPHLYFEENSFQRRKPRSSFLHGLTSSVASMFRKRNFIWK